MVPEEGIEPTRPCGHRILSPARLPVSPLRPGVVRPFRTQVKLQYTALAKLRLGPLRPHAMTHIGPTLVIVGEFDSQEETTIEGRIDGRVNVRAGFLTITPHATVNADVRGVRVYIQGYVKGGVTATERIELGSTAQVEGALSANQVVIDEGARFEGGIDMGQRTIASKMAHYLADHAPAVTAPTAGTTTIR
jgi:cytoskeletal protein CcmA (bactofilin family)